MGTIQPSSKPRKWTRWLLFAFILIVVGLGASELLLRAIGLGNPILIQPDEAAGYIFEPNQTLHRFGGLVRIDSHGMRSDPLPPSKPAGTFRLLLVGDSYTYGTTDVDQSRIFAELLHKELPSIIDKPVEVLNASTGGWAIGNEVGFVRSRGLFNADLVLLVLNPGDQTQPFEPYRPDGMSPTIDHHPSFALQEIWERYLKLRLFPPKPEPPAPQSTLDEQKRAAAQNLVYLDQLLQLTRAAKTPLAVAYIPTPAETDPPSGLIAWCASRRVPLINLTSAASHWNPNEVLREDHAHYNTKGHRLIATELEKDWSTIMPAAANSAQSEQP